MNIARLSALLLVTFMASAGCAHRAAVVPADSPGMRPTVATVAPDAAAAGTALPVAGTERADAEVDEEPAAVEAGQGPAAARGEVSDPIAGWNRAMFTFNDRLYFWVLKPVARGYRAVVPGFVRTGVRNFFHNLTTPGRLVSDVVQLKGREAGIELGKFMINTTWGVLGLWDVFAANPEAKIPEGDLGLAMGHYGVANGPYIVWPFLGPSTLRDSVGLVGDFLLDPTTYVQPRTAATGIYVYREVNTTTFRIGDYEAVKEAAIDPYIAIRQAYIQHRARAGDTYEPEQNFIYP
ncbi:MAG TPA: VacJ family lipoprotein [bacterium]